MMDKSALACETVGGGGARRPPFTISTITYKVAVTLLLRGQIHSLYSISTLYVLCDFCHVEQDLPEAEFLDEIQTKFLRVFLLVIHSHLQSFA